MTLQRRDLLTYREKKYLLNRDIFQSYFIENPGLKPQKLGFDSNLHRGYFSEFKIVEEQLMVVDIRVNFDFDRDTGAYLSKSVILDVISNQRACVWFSGTLLMYSTKARANEERECLKMEIDKGRLVEVLCISNQEYDNLGNHAYDYF